MEGPVLPLHHLLEDALHELPLHVVRGELLRNLQVRSARSEVRELLQHDLIGQPEDSVYLRKVGQVELAVSQSHGVGEHQLGRPHRPVEVYRLEHLVPRDEERLESVEGGPLQEQVVVGANAHRVDDALDVHLPVLDPCEVGVPQKVVHHVGAQTTGDDLVHERPAPRLAYAELRYLRRLVAVPPQDISYFRLGHYPLGQIFVGQVGLLCQDLFEEVGERPVPNVMEEGGDPQLLDVVVPEPRFVRQRLRDEASDVHRPDHVLEPAVHAAGVD